MIISLTSIFFFMHENLIRFIGKFVELNGDKGSVISV